MWVRVPPSVPPLELNEYFSRQYSIEFSQSSGNEDDTLVNQTKERRNFSKKVAESSRSCVAIHSSRV